MSIRLTIKNRDIWVCLCALPCLFMMLVTSRGFTVVKIVLLCLTALFCALDLTSGGKGISHNHIIYVLLFAIYYMGSLLLGILNGYEWSLRIGGASLIVNFCVIPFIVLVISAFLKKHNNYLNGLIAFVRWTAVFIVIMNVWKLIALMSALPDIDFLNLFYISSTQTTGGLAMRISNEHNLIYLLPFFTVMTFMDKNRRNRAPNLAVFLVGVVYSLMSGRKALEITLFGTIFITILYITLKKNSAKPLLAAVMMGIFFLITANLMAPLLGIDNYIVAARDTLIEGISSKSAGMTVRSLSVRSLIKLWLGSPIVGNGLNAYGEYIAAFPDKWSYEVFYVALLAQTGLIGVFMLFSAVFYILRNLRMMYGKYKNPVYLAAYAGMACFVLSGATNPMLYTPWPWILSLALSCSEIEYEPGPRHFGLCRNN